MNSNPQLPIDSLIEREVESLRQPVTAKRGIGDAIQAMQAPAGRRIALQWPLGIGWALAGVGAVAVIMTLSAGSAYAGELRAIDAAQTKQQTRYQHSTLFGESDKPAMIMEFWRDGEQEAYRQYTSDHKLSIVRVFDGRRKFHYETYNPSTGTYWASVEKATKPDFGIETLSAILSGRLARQHPVIKKTGVSLKGRICDYYSLGNGHYRIWVDPQTKLPVQREIYHRGVSLWKRDTYTYPPSFPRDTFKPYLADKIQYKEIVRPPLSGAAKAKR